MRLLVVFLALAACAQAQVAHPRIRFDKVKLTRLTAMVSTNDAVVAPDIKPGVYTARPEGAVAYRGIRTGLDGRLGFLSNAGATFEVVLRAAPSAAFQGRGGISGHSALR